MSQFFDQASLVMVPSGYKNGKVYSQKPLSADGELTFTRSNDTATRVGPDGLIEKVRTNLILQSNTFSNAAWNKANVTLTSGQPDKDGGTNAWRVQFTGSSSDSYIYQDITNQLNAGSIYVKGTAGETALIGVRTSVGGGALTTFNGSWQRVIDTNASNGYFVISDYGSATATDFLIMNAQVEAGDIATDYIATTTAAVSVGPVANLPRLDYTDSTCPKLLLEPQRTNLATYSEQFDNAAYVKVNTSVTANATTSPDGYTNADKIESTAAPAAGIELRQTFTLTAQSYVASVYLKQGSGSTDLSNFDIYNGGGSYQAQTSLNFATGVLTQSIGTGASVVDVGNGWFRVLVPFTGYAGTNYIYIGNSGYYEASGKYVYAYGFSLEEGAYGTSYIPTLGAAVTRGADVCYKAGISSLIGATAGTLYSEFVVNGFANFGTPLCINNGGTAESIWLTTFANGDIRAEVFSTAGGGVQASFTKSGNVVGQTYKIAIGYAANNFAFFVNGLQVGSTDTSGSVPVSMNRVDFDYTIPASFVVSALGINQALLFTTRLTNAQLAELTTI